MSWISSKLFSIIFISCLEILIYSNTFSCSFHYDDIRFIIDNPSIQDIHQLYNVWNYWHCRFITFLSLAINYHFNGSNVFGYHLFNLLVHLISGILVWWLTLLTLSTPAMKEDKITRHANTLALLTGLIFVSHPVQTEAVTYIWQRAASMAALFYLASLCFYVKSRLSLQHPVLERLTSTPGVGAVGLRKFYYIVSLITAVMAMFCKETAITLPIMILFYELTFFNMRKGFDWKYISPFLLTIFIIPITFLFSKSEIFQDHHGDLGLTGIIITPMHYFLTEFRVMLTYIRLVFLPINQNFDYDYPIFNNIFQLPVLFSSILLITIFYWAKHLLSKYRLISFSIFWFFLTLIIPESSFWAMGDVILEYRLYLPLAGYSIFLVSAVYYLFGRNSFKAMVIVLLGIIAFNSMLTYQRNKVWNDDFTLWNDTVGKSPHKARPYNNRGSSYSNQEKFIQAMSDYTKAIEINPKYADAYYNRGTIYYNQGNLILAMADYNKAIETNPNYADAYYNRGFIYAKQGKLVQAIADYSKSIEINDSRADAYDQRALEYYEQGDLTRAVSDFNKAIKINPKDAGSYNNRAFIYYLLGKYDKSWEDAHRAEYLGYVIDPNFINSLKNALHEEK